MKKNLRYVLLAAMMIIGSIFTVRVVRERNKSSMLEKNFEALVDGEYRVGIGVVCAYDINSWCIYYDPYEEYPGAPVSDPVIGPWQ